MALVVVCDSEGIQAKTHQGKRRTGPSPRRPGSQPSSPVGGVRTALLPEMSSDLHKVRPAQEAQPSPGVQGFFWGGPRGIADRLC